MDEISIIVAVAVFSFLLGFLARGELARALEKRKKKHD